MGLLMSRALTRKYPITLINMGSPEGGEALYDINGERVLGIRSGEPVSLYSAEFIEMRTNGHIKMVHVDDPGYSFITVCNIDYLQFIEETEYGADIPYQDYYVYFYEPFEGEARKDMVYYVDQQ